MTYGEIQTIIQLLEAVVKGRVSIEDAHEILDYIAEKKE